MRVSGASRGVARMGFIAVHSAFVAQDNRWSHFRIRNAGSRVSVGMALLRWLCVLPLALVLSAPGFASTALDHARRAQAMLGGEVWSRVVRVENSSVWTAYPCTVYALVFELGGILWIYTAMDGTQSFSLETGKLAEDRKDFTPLLQAIESGFERYRVLPPSNRPVVTSDGERLPNGCFIESYAALRARMSSGEMLLYGRLLSIYADEGGIVKGHTVLFYQTPDGTFVLDPDAPAQPRWIAPELSADPMGIARTLYGDIAIVRARWVPTTLPNGALIAVAEAAARPLAVGVDANPAGLDG